MVYGRHDRYNRHHIHRRKQAAIKRDKTNRKKKRKYINYTMATTNEVSSLYEIVLWYGDQCKTIFKTEYKNLNEYYEKIYCDKHKDIEKILETINGKEIYTIEKQRKFNKFILEYLYRYRTKTDEKLFPSAVSKIVIKRVRVSM